MSEISGHHGFGWANPSERARRRKELEAKDRQVRRMIWLKTAAIVLVLVALAAGGVYYNIYHT